MARYNAQFGRGSGQVFISNMYCTGSEKSLLECRHHSCNIVSCTNHNDAGVVCESKIALDL